MANTTPPSSSVSVIPTAPAAPRHIRRPQRQPTTTGHVIPLAFEMEAKPVPRLNLFEYISSSGVGPHRWAEMPDRAAHSGEVSDTLDRLLVEHDAEATLKCMQKDMHEERLKQLRQLQTSILEDDWRYDPIEKLIGLQ